MADVRALLKAKRQETKVSHPLATYTAAGQLKCIACGTSVNAWTGHIGSKTHRTNVARLREEERAREAHIAQPKPSDDELAHPPKRQRRDDQPAAVPPDFFSDPSQAPPLGETDLSADLPHQPVTHPADSSLLDLEWQQFQQAVLDAPRESYEHATIVAEPVLNPDVLKGFPPHDAHLPEPEPELDEGALRRKKDQEERELIMDRLLEEERAQEDADAKVVVLKNRLEMIKKRREAARAAKTTQA